MKLEAFRLQNYKKVQDTGWIDCESMTVLVGKNEAGKCQRAVKTSHGWALENQPL